MSIDMNSLKFWYNCLLKPAFVAARILITTSVLLGYIGLFKLVKWSWINFDKLYLLRKLSIYLRLSNLMEYRFLKYVLLTLWVFCVSCFEPLFIFMFLMWDFSLFSINLAKVLLIWLIISKNQILVLCLVDYLYFVDVSFFSTSALN